MNLPNNDPRANSTRDPNIGVTRALDLVSTLVLPYRTSVNGLALTPMPSCRHLAAKKQALPEASKDLLRLLKAIGKPGALSLASKDPRRLLQALGETGNPSLTFEEPRRLLQALGDPGNPS